MFISSNVCVVSNDFGRWCKLP